MSPRQRWQYVLWAWIAVMVLSFLAGLVTGLFFRWVR